MFIATDIWDEIVNELELYPFEMSRGRSLRDYFYKRR